MDLMKAVWHSRGHLITQRIQIAHSKEATEVERRKSEEKTRNQSLQVRKKSMSCLKKALQ
jgi:hypothetical protein